MKKSHSDISSTIVCLITIYLRIFTKFWFLSFKKIFCLNLFKVVLIYNDCSVVQKKMHWIDNLIFFVLSLVSYYCTKLRFMKNCEVITKRTCFNLNSVYWYSNSYMHYCLPISSLMLIIKYRNKHNIVS